MLKRQVQSQIRREGEYDIDVADSWNAEISSLLDWTTLSLQNLTVSETLADAVCDYEVHYSSHNVHASSKHQVAFWDQQYATYISRNIRCSLVYPLHGPWHLWADIEECTESEESEPPVLVHPQPILIRTYIGAEEVYMEWPGYISPPNPEYDHVRTHKASSTRVKLLDVHGINPLGQPAAGCSW